MSPVQFRAEDAGRRMTTLYRGADIPENFSRYMLNPRYRIPLWQLVYHDCAVSYWYWGDSSNCCPELMIFRDLFDALCGEPPLYSLTATQWEELKEQIAESYHRATPVARAAGLERMIAFDCLTGDRTVQRSVFANGLTVTVNFSDRDFTAEDGTVLPARTFRMTTGEK